MRKNTLHIILNRTRVHFTGVFMMAVGIVGFILVLWIVMAITRVLAG